LRYGDPDACLRDLAQQALEATQRAQLEAECRSLVRPPAPQQPVYVVPGYGIPQHHYPPPAAPAATTPAARQCSAEWAEHGHLCAGQALQPLSKRKTQPHRK
jgi:hypothetical protein